MNALQQYFDAELSRADVIERRDLPAERMIPAAKYTGFFQRKNVGRLFCDAEQNGRARRVGTNFTNFACSKEPAQIASMNGLARVSDGARNLRRLIAARPHHPERDPLRRARTDARQQSHLCT